jgi:hypothetical protein
MLFTSKTIARLRIGSKLIHSFQAIVMTVLIETQLETSYFSANFLASSSKDHSG